VMPMCASTSEISVESSAAVWETLGTKLGFDRRTMAMKPMSVEQCVSEGLNALRKNRSRMVPGRLNRFMDAFVPAFVKRTMTANLLGKALAKKEAANARAQGAGSPALCRSSF